MRIACMRPCLRLSTPGRIVPALAGACLASLTLLSPLDAQGTLVRFQEQFSPEDLMLERVAWPGEQTVLTRVRLRGALQTREPGFPMLPCVIRHVALPGGAEVVALRVDPGQEMTQEGHPVLDWYRGDRPGQAARREPKLPEYPETPDGPLYYPPPEDPVPLDPSLQQYASWPPEPATVLESRLLGGYQLVTLRVCPVSWEPRSGAIRLATGMTVAVEFKGGRIPDPKRTDYAHLSELEDLRGLVVNIDDLPSFTIPIPMDLDAWYLVITDNKRWNENKTPGSGLSGDMVAEFERLAEWKTQKGVKAAVVTITDILANKYGFFNPVGTRDTQEVIRNFIKHARAEFNTSWVLLGGDVSVLPARHVLAHTGYGDHFVGLQDETRPPENKCYWDAAGARVRIHHDGYISQSVVIVGRKTGRAFSRVTSPSAANPGWSYVTSDSYATETASKTDFIRLVGPLADTELVDFYTVRDLNTIPTDLYYASLVSPFYDQPGKHDWDLNDNGFYGQYFEAVAVDGADYAPDINVGRAPVESGAEAKAFVDKLIAYEKYDGLGSAFGRKLLLGGANWGGGPAVSSGGGSPPAEGTYYGPAGATSSLCRFKGPPDGATAYDLIAYDAPGDHWVVPYNRSASASSLGYFFCTSATYGQRSEIFFDWWLIHVEIPIPTKYVKVLGPSSLVHPAKYFFDSVEPDLAVTEKEELKDLFSAHLSAMSQRKRLYEDLEDTPGYPDPDLFELSETAMKAELNSGYNMVSLSGHGWPGGCCAVSRDYVDDLTNGFRGGVVYAESCSTNRFTDSDAVSEVFLKTAAGGAVGYVGNSRYSWVGQGDDLERLFWNRLRFDHHLGRLHNAKASLADNNAHRWAQYALNLEGCPEMPVWVGTPDTFHVAHSSCVTKPSSFEVTVTRGGAPVILARVCLTGPRGIFELHYTGVTGQTTFFTSDKESGDELLITVTKDDFVPYQGTVRIGICDRITFVRGDANGDLALDISDGVFIFGFLFLGEESPKCDDAADTNDDGEIDISDGVAILNYLFLGDLLPPGTKPGEPQEDDTPDLLRCRG